MKTSDYIFISIIAIPLIGILLAGIIGANAPEKYKIYYENNSTILERI